MGQKQVTLSGHFQAEGIAHQELNIRHGLNGGLFWETVYQKGEWRFLFLVLVCKYTFPVAHTGGGRGGEKRERK